MQRPKRTHRRSAGFRVAQPVSEGFIADRLPRIFDVRAIMLRLKSQYAHRGVNLVQVDDAWAFRTAADLSFVIRRDENEVRSCRAPPRSAGDHRLSPAGDACRNRGYPRRADLARHARRADGGGLGSVSWPPAHPGRPVTLGHHARLPRPFRPGGAARSAGPRRAEGGRAAVRPHPGQFQHSRAA
jgi:hypothetical protein